MFDVVLVFLYEEGDEADEGLVLIGCGRVYGREVEESEVGWEGGSTGLDVGFEEWSLGDGDDENGCIESRVVFG